MIHAVIVPDEATVAEVAAMPEAAHLHLITNGRSTVLSPVVPPGWFRVSIHIKPAQERAA